MKKVLIVEDELSISNFIADIIQLMGYETKILTNGKKVVATVKEWKPDLITLDIMIPPPDGIELLSLLKNDPETKEIPVFVISVVANKVELSGDLAKAQGLFEKPLVTKHFISEVQKFCEGRPLDKNG